MSRKPAPALVLSLVVVFFALGGSALAFGHSGVARGCGAGNVKGAVVLDAEVSFPDAYTTRGLRGGYNCSGRGVQVWQRDVGVYDVRFPNNPGLVAVATPIAFGGSIFLTWSPVGRGVFRIFVTDSNGDPINGSFALMVT